MLYITDLDFRLIDLFLLPQELNVVDSSMLLKISFFWFCFFCQKVQYWDWEYNMSKTVPVFTNHFRDILYVSDKKVYGMNFLSKKFLDEIGKIINVSITHFDTWNFYPSNALIIHLEDFCSI